MLDALHGRRVLLLQGPAGPFFRRLAALLRARGATVTKVNFNAADCVFYRGSDVACFRGRFEEWPDYFEQLVRERKIEAVVLFGDTRPLHQVAIRKSAELELGVSVLVIEEGYLRPDFVTIEAGGVGVRSSIPRDPEFYRRLNPTELPEPQPVGNVMLPAALYTVVYACSQALFKRHYPHYQHHRDIRPLHQAYYWARGGIRRVEHARRDRPIDARIAGGQLAPFFLVPLQVHLDAAVRDSSFPEIEDFVVEVVRSFAEHAPEECWLLIKDHPLGRPYRDYSALLERLRTRHRLGQRLCYVDVIHLPTALRHARGTVVINSTVGLSSIHHGTPVKCLGQAVYDMPGLTFQGSLDEFWRNPGEVDSELYRRFRWWLRTNNQVNGSVWKTLWP